MSKLDQEDNPRSSAQRNLYLDLIKRCVNNYLYLGGLETVDSYYTDSTERYSNFAWKVPRDCQPHSLLHRNQLDYLEKILVQLHERGVPGDLLEAGVWRGGAVVLMRAVVKAYDMDRTVIAADSFTGIPHSKSLEGDPVDRWEDRWEASLEEVKSIIDRYGLLDERIKFLPGKFEESLPRAGLTDLALIRLDADSYESTSQALEFLYPALNPGGVVIIDDWHLPGCIAAVAEFRAKHNVKSAILQEEMNFCWTK